MGVTILADRSHPICIWESPFLPIVDPLANPGTAFMVWYECAFSLSIAPKGQPAGGYTVLQWSAAFCLAPVSFSTGVLQLPVPYFCAAEGPRRELQHCRSGYSLTLQQSRIFAVGREKGRCLLLPGPEPIDAVTKISWGAKKAFKDLIRPLRAL